MANKIRSGQTVNVPVASPIIIPERMIFAGSYADTSLAGGRFMHPNACNVLFGQTVGTMPSAMGTTNVFSALIIPFAGTLKNLTVNCSGPATFPGHNFVEIFKNGSATVLICPVGSTTNFMQDNVHTVDVVLGDNISIFMSQQGPNVQVSWSFELVPA